jgi:hypothetical protein
MTLDEILGGRGAAVCDRWLGEILGEYGEVTALRWRKERDPFANPVGHALTTGLPQLLEAVRRDVELPEGAARALEAIIRIRSVQDMAPSRAVAFVLRLRGAIRQELEAELSGGAHAAELAALDGRIERLALQAFDQYVRIREQIFRLRQDELRRSVATLLRRWHAELPAEPIEAPSELVRLTAPSTGADQR